MAAKTRTLAFGEFGLVGQLPRTLAKPAGLIRGRFPASDFVW
jgi:hypothetical protein